MKLYSIKKQNKTKHFLKYILTLLIHFLDLFNQTINSSAQTLSYANKYLLEKNQNKTDTYVIKLHRTTHTHTHTHTHTQRSPSPAAEGVRQRGE